MSSDEEGGGRRGLGGGGGGLGFGGRKKRRQNDENLLGVFAEGEDDSDDGGKGKKGKGKGKSKKGKMSDAEQSMQVNIPLNFISAGQINKAKVHVPEKKPDKDESEEEPEIDPRFDLSAAIKEDPVEHGPKRQAVNKMSFTQMAAEYGQGFAMLQKMGFTGGGLGRHNDGIANPIEVNLRKGKAGIQDEGEKVDQDLFGTDAKHNKRSVEELLSSKEGKSSGPKASEDWKQGSKRPKTVYKTAAEVAAKAAAPGAMRIIDMRGPETKIVSSIAELQASISGDTIKSLKELRHNTRLLVAKYEERIRAVAEKKKHFEDVLISVSKESEQAKTAKSLSPTEIKQCKAMVRKIEDLRRLQDQAAIDLKELGAAFGSLRSENPRAFQALRAFDVAISFAVPVAKRELAAWKPLQKPKEGLVGLASWKGLLGAEDAKAINTLCDEVLLPKLRSALIDWNVRDFDPCIQLFECCRKALPSHATETLGVHIVLPRLQVEVDSWDPRTDKMPLHIWIHPWLPILGSKLKSLWTPIRFKLSACLEQWDTRDRSACNVLKPWQHVFEPADWEPLVEKVVSKLERAIADTPVLPSGQDVQPIEDLLAWLEIIPVALVARVLESAFFPQWHAALRQWMRSPECNFNEVLQWYQGWRTLLPKVLCEVPSVQKQLARGLEVMKSMMSGGGGEAEDDEASERPPTRAPPSPPASGTKARAASAVLPEDVPLSLSDYMGDVAAENGLVFRPKASTTHMGKQVYLFGKVSVYFDKNLVYAAPKGGGDEWLPVSFDEVLTLAKR